MFDYSVKFKAIDNISKKINAINKRMEKMAGKARVASSKIQASLGRMNFRASLRLNVSKALANIKKVSSRMRRLNKQGMDMATGGIQRIVAGAGFLASALVPVNVARQYELAFKDVKKAVSGTPEELASLRREMKGFAGASFEEIAVVNAEAGKMGFSADKVMAFSKAVIKGAKALDFDAQMAVGQVGKILSMTNQMDTAVSSGQDIMNKVVHLENSLAGVKGAGIIDVWKRSAEEFSQLNFDNSQMAAMSGFLEQVSTSSELGASSFKIMMNRFKSMEGKLGFVEKIRTGGFEGLKQVMQEISKLSPEEQIKMFGSEAMSLINKLQNKKNLAKLDFALSISKKSQGAVAKEWLLFRATFDERVNDTKKNISNLADTIGTPLMKVAADFMAMVNPVIKGVSAWVKQNKELTVTIFKWVGIIGAVVVALGTLSVIFGAVTMAVSVLTPLMFLFNAALWANPITWVVIAVVALGAAIYQLIKYWDDIVWVANYFFGRIGDWVASTFTLENAIAGIADVFGTLTAPIRFVIDLIDSFLSKFDIYNKAKAQVAGIADSVSGAVSDAWGSVKGFVGMGDINTGIDNTTKNHTVVDVNVTASGGAEAAMKARSTGGVNLRKTVNGI